MFSATWTGPETVQTIGWEIDRGQYILYVAKPRPHSDSLFNRMRLRPAHLPRSSFCPLRAKFSLLLCSTWEYCNSLQLQISTPHRHCRESHCDLSRCPPTSPLFPLIPESITKQCPEGKRKSLPSNIARWHRYATYPLLRRIEPSSAQISPNFKA